KRLQKELMALQSDPPPGMTLNERSVQNTITEWLIDMEGAPGTLYEGEKFQLLFKFSGRYPFDSPQYTDVRSVSDILDVLESVDNRTNERSLYRLHKDPSIGNK
ncbi:Ubiquitin-conjugating enzyme E2 W, partial [Anabarilius grahami]